MATHAVMYMLQILCILVTRMSCQPSIFDARVYNFYYYVQHNPELTESHIYSEQQAAQHWQTIGIVQGLQACGSFHVLQFIDNYPDTLNTACPPPQQNYSCAIDYYLSTGYHANMLGYTVGGAYGKYTLSSIGTSQPNLGLFVSLSERMGGSIDSIVYQNYEYINSWDHGRNLQISAATKYGECYELSESGSIQDAQTNQSSSNILSIQANVTNILTQTLPAFYMAAGSCESDDGCGCAKNTENVSDYKITKSIHLKYGYQNSFWISYVSTIYIAEDLDVIHIKAPALSANAEMNSFWKMTNTWNSEIYPVEINDQGGTFKVMADGIGPQLLIQATNDTKHTVSILPIIPQTCNGGIWIKNNLGLSEYAANQSSTQYLEYVYYNVSKGTSIDLETVICVGSIQDIQMCTGFASVSTAPFMR